MATIVAFGIKFGVLATIKSVEAVKIIPKLHIGAALSVYGSRSEGFPTIALNIVIFEAAI